MRTVHSLRLSQLPETEWETVTLSPGGSALRLGGGCGMMGVELMSRPGMEDGPKGMQRTGYTHIAF